MPGKTLIPGLTVRAWTTLTQVASAPLGAATATQIAFCVATKPALVKALSKVQPRVTPWAAIHPLVEGLSIALVATGDDAARSGERHLLRIAKRADAPAWLFRCLGNVQVRRGAHRSALNRYAQAESRAAHDEAETLRIALQRARLLVSDRRVSDGLHELRVIVNEARGMGCPRSLGIVLSDYAVAAQMLARLDEALAATIEARTLLEERAERDLLLARIVMIHIDRLEFPKAKKLLTELRRSPDPQIKLRHAFASAFMSLYEKTSSSLAKMEAAASQARKLGLVAFEAYAWYDLSIAAIDQHKPERAASAAKRALKLAQDHGIDPVTHGAQLAAIAAYALAGKSALAIALLRKMRQVEFDPVSAAFGHALRAFIYAHLAALVAAPRAAVFASLAAAERRRFESSPAKNLIFPRILQRNLDIQRPVRSVPQIAADASFVDTPDGERIDLRRRPSHRRILLRLIGQGSVVTSDLVRAGWPGDRSAPTSLHRRLRVAMFHLRKIGLGDYIQHQRGSYLLDPVVRVVKSPPD